MQEAVVSLYQKQEKIYPRAVSGRFAAWRWGLVWATQAVFYGLPWLHIHGRQAMLFDLEARRFYILGWVLYPQDFIYLTGLLVVSAYALFLFTAVAGRLWCGYACPQTVYTEIFLWIERQFEGDRLRRQRLDAQAWSFDKLWRKAGKHTVWLALGLWTGFTFVGYFTPIRSLGASALALQLGPWEWFWSLFYGLATYGNAGFLREQVCKYMCPYARFQGAMFDRHTLIIGYDSQRGEPRGKHREQGRKTDLAAAGLGHCIDCGLCVQVCPTGIDIRNGLQYECIGCAACVDVCDTVMDKMQYPRGLVRYDTLDGFTHSAPTATPLQSLPQKLTQKLPQTLSQSLLQHLLRPRVLVYAAGLLLISGALMWGLLTRAPFRVDVVRDRSALARTVDGGWVENVYRLQIMNATEDTQHYRVAASGLAQMKHDLQGSVSLGPAQARWVVLAVRVPPEVAAQAGAGSHAMQFEVSQLPAAAPAPSAPPRTLVEKSSFVVPR